MYRYSVPSTNIIAYNQHIYTNILVHVKQYYTTILA